MHAMTLPFGLRVCVCVSHTLPTCELFSQVVPTVHPELVKVDFYCIICLTLHRTCAHNSKHALGSVNKLNADSTTTCFFGLALNQACVQRSLPPSPVPCAHKVGICTQTRVRAMCMAQCQRMHAKRQRATSAL